MNRYYAFAIPFALLIACSLVRADQASSLPSRRTVVLGAEAELSSKEVDLWKQAGDDALKELASTKGYTVVEEKSVFYVLPPKYDRDNGYLLQLQLMDLIAQTGIGTPIALRSFPKETKAGFDSYLKTSGLLSPIRDALLGASDYSITPYAVGQFNVESNGKTLSVKVSTRSLQQKEATKAVEPIKDDSTKPQADESVKKEYDLAIYVFGPVADDVERVEFEARLLEICRDRLKSLRDQYNTNLKLVADGLADGSPFGNFSDGSSFDSLPDQLRNQLLANLLSKAGENGMSERDIKEFLRNGKVTLQKGSLNYGIEMPSVSKNGSTMHLSLPLGAILKDRL